MPRLITGRTAETRFGLQPCVPWLRWYGISISIAAVELRVPYQTLQKIIHGTQAPKPGLADAMAELLDVSPSQCFTDEARRAGGEDV